MHQRDPPENTSAQPNLLGCENTFPYTLGSVNQPISGRDGYHRYGTEFQCVSREKSIDVNEKLGDSTPGRKTVEAWLSTKWA
jgi:hypothetical protein